MNHEQAKDLLSEWLDGELDAAAGAAVSAHAASCAACGTESARLRRLGPALFAAAAAPDPRATEAFVARVMARVEADSVSAWERFAGRVLTPAFGLALAALLLGIYLPSADADAPLGVTASVDADAVLGVAP